MNVQKIKQQKQIKQFLTEQFGPEKGRALLEQQQTSLRTLLQNIGDKSPNQQRTLAQQILPCIALYQALQNSGFLQKEAYRHTRTYMLKYVAAKQHASTAKMELVPGFYFLYSAIFRRVMRTSDLWESTQARSRDSFDITIRACLWHTTCAENGCAELCRLFCEADNVTYGGLRKIGFARTRTLGCGGDCCDFHFFRKGNIKADLY